MLIIVTRTLILYAVVVIALRFMGKREIGQLQLFDLVGIIMISELAAIPSENVGIPLIAGIIPILVILLVSTLLAIVELKSERARAILNGTPSILIERGKIVESELKRNRYNLTDLLEELRMKNIPNISDVEFAVLETNGQLSVLPKSLKRPTTPEDFNMCPSFEGLPTILIMDGKLHQVNLQRIDKDLQWLLEELKKQNIHRVEDVFLASLDTSGTLFLQEKSKR
ncbi:DUF421 domain-containing protein [Desulfitobacterium metallireducens]|uniref:Membrane protein n=1 Tax=Desulfitobacterium metallireducens DSM 15288 TaxID=871968 RepID=W0E8E9_9FIRM|nr:DUF421 domain-containing protein [Desulfitobacterium metallireducens]AHF07140.1 membrane protein [Desulfitobacterium metallireducens DSM 15288]